MSECKGPAEMVREFHERFGLVVRDELQTGLPDDEVTLRRRLIGEEAEEVDEALWDGDPAQVAAELADLLYVAYGTALHYGFDLDAAVAEVHRANMSKLGDDGQPIRRDDGKILKGPNFKPPDVARAIGVCA